MRPQIYEATTELGVQEPTGSPTGSPAGGPARDSAGERREAARPYVQSDLDVEFDGSVYQEVGLARTKSSKKYKIAIDESAETVEKAKTTIINVVRYYHDEVTHPDEVHEE